MITLAKTAGFCFGVDRAVQIVYNLLEENKPVATLGPIIHNPQLVEDLIQKGARIINSPEEANRNETVVIRSHGVSKQVYDTLNKNGIAYIDATCPYVSKIQRIVYEQSLNGATIIIAGDSEHPEVVGICGHIVNNVEYLVVSNEQELENLGKKLTKEQCENIVLLAQTTLNANFWETCRKFTKKLYTNAKIFDTICSATSKRQNEVLEMAKINDLMIIIGGKQSSNTKKLFELCQVYTKTYLIETYQELPKLNLSKFDNIGISAGASTPAYIIEEALRVMSEILQNEMEEDFATLFEQSTMEEQKIYNGKRVKGIVTSFNNSEVHVDIGAKQAGIIPASELTDDPNARVADIVNKGDEIDLVVVKVNDQEGVVTLSKKRSDAFAGFKKILTAHAEDAVLDGIICDVVRGGVLVYTCGTKIFVPASQASNSRVEDLTTLLKQEVKLKILELDEIKHRAKGSVRAVLSAERKEQQAKFWETIEIGKKFEGEVKSLTDYGAFVDLGGIDGMIHITELSWSKIKHPSEVLKKGDRIEVYIKDLDKEKKRISLGYRNNSENPWALFDKQYGVGDVVTAKLVSFTNYGAFAEIIPGVDGLIHISQIANQRVEKVSDVLNIGESVDVKIIEVDTDKKRISLSIRAVSSNDSSDND